MNFRSTDVGDLIFFFHVRTSGRFGRSTIRVSGTFEVTAPSWSNYEASFARRVMLRKARHARARAFPSA